MKKICKIIKHVERLFNLVSLYLGCTACEQIQITFKGEPNKGHQNKKLGNYIINGTANGRDIWISTSNIHGQFYIWYSKSFRKWAIGIGNEKNADIYQDSSFVNNKKLAGIVSKENFLECPFNLESEDWSYHSDLGMTSAEKNEINVVCTKSG